MHPIDQVTKQLHKLVNVLKIRDLEPEETLARELALFKVSADGAARAEVMQICEIFRAKIVDVSKRSVVVEVTGTLRQGRGVRAAGPAVRADRDGAHRRDRDLARAQRDLDPNGGGRRRASKPATVRVRLGDRARRRRAAARRSGSSAAACTGSSARIDSALAAARATAPRR